jgi:hypothetical protein
VAAIGKAIGKVCAIMVLNPKFRLSRLRVVQTWGGFGVELV